VGRSSLRRRARAAKGWRILRRRCGPSAALSVVLGVGVLVWADGAGAAGVNLWRPAAQQALRLVDERLDPIELGLRHGALSTPPHRPRTASTEGPKAVGAAIELWA
jgi:hypothetical protein